MLSEKIPYYAVIFTSKQTGDLKGYTKMSDYMVALAKEQPGFLKVDSARQSVGITISYWESLEAISSWKQNAEHVLAQKLGKQKWYSWYNVRICKVEREYEFNAN